MPTPRFTNLPLVYCAGAYTNPDPVENTHNAICFADDLATEGVVTPVLPHTTLLWHIVRPHADIDFWYEYDLAILQRCDALYRMEGASSGADAEVEKANEWGIPVLTDIKKLYEWAADDSVTW